MNQLAIIPDREVNPVMELENTQKLCQKLMASKHYAKMGEDGVFAIVTKAKAMGIDPIDALNGSFYYVQGKVGMSAEMMASLIRQKGHSIIKDSKSTNDICILHGKRADNGDTWTITFSMDDARKAGLAKNMYDKYPASMLYNRAMSMLARQLFPDIIKGAGYTMEELKEIRENKPELQNVQLEEVKQEIEIISKEQADKLVEILGECDPEYQGKVLEFVKKAPVNAENIYSIPVNFYDRIYMAACKKREEAKSKPIEVVIETEIQEKTA